jgi:NNP family nitrate/nitrite transporter-like MFS transporter
MVMVAFGWQAVAQLWALGLVIMAGIFWFGTRDDPELTKRRAEGREPEPMSAMLAPLKKLQVWRFSLYYFFVFGGFVALALWLPRYYVGVYGLDIVTAGFLGAAYSIPGSLFRIFGGTLSDRFGARRVMYWTLIGSVACTFLLSYPATTYVVDGIRGPIEFTLALGFIPFTALTFVLGFFMSLGKAAVYKHIPVYYPGRVGPVGGVVGLIGGLGGFVLPIAFGAMNDLVGVWTSCFMLLFLIAGVSLIWMHFAILYMEKRKIPALAGPQYLPEADVIGSVLPAPASLIPAPQPAPANKQRRSSPAGAVARVHIEQG